MTNRKAVVTGGASGIGKSIAETFLDAGIQVVTCDIDTPDNPAGTFFPADLTQPRQISRFTQNVRDLIGSPDVLVCNAGQGVHEKLTEGDPEIWEQIFRLNVFGTFRLIREFVPDMLKNGAGDVVFISSVSSFHTYPYGGIYASSKAAIDMLAETLRLETQPAVRTTVIRPGVVDTNFFDHMIHGEQTPEDIGWGALAPEQIAQAVHYAISLPADSALNELTIRPAAQPM